MLATHINQGQIKKIFKEEFVMKKNIKKIVAGILSASMLLGTSALAFADNLSSGGTNSNPSGMEDFVSTDVFKVVVPTNATADTFKFILDPQKLITLTSGAAYGNDKFVSGGTLYFQNTSGNANFTSEGGVGYKYSSKSDQLTVINKSTMDVDVTITATLASAGSLQFTSGADFTSSGDKAPKVYLALINADKELASAGTGTKAITATAATDVTLLSGAEDGAYHFIHSSGHKYAYELTSSADSNPAFSRMNFYVTGEANPYGDFTSAKNETPTLNITWRVVPHGTSSSLSSGGTSNAGGSGSGSTSPSLSATSVSSTSNTVTVSNGTVSKVVLNKTDGREVELTLDNQYSISGSTITFKASTVTNNAGGSFTVTFAEGGTASLAIN